MQRFVLVLEETTNDDSNAPEWSKQLALDKELQSIPYCLRMNFAAFNNEWIEIHELESSMNSMEPQLTEDASLYTTFASMIHTACSKLRSHLCTNPCFFSLELVWKFPVLSKTDTSNQTLIEGFMAMYGALQRFVELNHGHIHIIRQQQPTEAEHATTRNEDDEEEEVDLFAVEAWKEIFGHHCTIWNWNANYTQHHELDASFHHILRHILKPMRLSCIAFNLGKHVQFGFDLIPCFLRKKGNDEHFVMNNKVLWKNWNLCYNWNSMKILQVVCKQSVSNHLLVSDVDILQHSQKQPALFVLNADNKHSAMLLEQWHLHKDVAWIVTFHHEEQQQHTHHCLYTHTQCRSIANQRAFMSEDEYMQFYITHTAQGAVHELDNASSSGSPPQPHSLSVSSKYLVYPVVDGVSAENEENVILVAHRMMEQEREHQANDYDALNIADWIHSMHRLTFQYSSYLTMHTENDEHVTQETRALYQNLISLPFLRYDENAHDLIHSDNDEHRTRIKQQCSFLINEEENNEVWREYNEAIRSQRQQILAMDDLKDDRKPDTPYSSVSSARDVNTDSLPVQMEVDDKPSLAISSVNRRKRSRATKSNRGLAAIQAAANQCAPQTPARSGNPLMHASASKIMQSAHLYRKAMEKEQANEWLSYENICSVFDENGELRDKAKQMHFKQMCADTQLVRKDWRLLKNTPELNGNFPIESRFYGASSMEYELKIGRIKKQFLNYCVNHAQENSFEIIGDLLAEERALCDHHPLSIISNTNRDNRKQTASEKLNNKAAVQREIELLLKNEMDKNADLESYRKIRTKMLFAIWKKMKADKNIDVERKLDSQVIEKYVAAKFEGMYCLLSSDVLDSD